MPGWWVSVLRSSGRKRTGAVIGSSRAGWQWWRWRTVYHRVAEAIASEWPSAGEGEGLAGGPNVSGLVGCVFPGPRDLSPFIRSGVAWSSMMAWSTGCGRHLGGGGGGGNRPSATPSPPHSAAGGPPLGAWGSWSRLFRELQDSAVATVLLAGCLLLRCLHGTERTQPTHMPLQQYLIGAPMERIGVDILGPFPVTEARNPFVLVAMDYFRGKCGAGSECFPDGAATSGWDVRPVRGAR